MVFIIIDKLIYFKDHFQIHFMMTFAIYFKDNNSQFI